VVTRPDPKGHGGYASEHPIRQEQMQTRFTLLSKTVVIAIKAYSATCSILDNII